MVEPRLTAVAIHAGNQVGNPAGNPTEAARAWVVPQFVGQAGVWAVDTAQQFGAIVSALLAPAVLSVYSFAVWSLADNLGWTDSFIFRTGAFSNWLVWLALALAVHSASAILRRQYPREKTTP